VPSVGAASGASTCSPPPASASSCRSSGGDKSGSVAAASGASSVGAGSPGADGSEAATDGAGSSPEGSARVAGSGATVAAPGSIWSCTALAALMTPKTLLSKWARARSSSDRRKTHNVDFFLAAFFTRQARRGTPGAGGEAWSADGGAPTTAIVTAVTADGPVSILSGSVPGSRTGRLQVDTVSIQHHRYLAARQISNSVPGGLDFLRLAFAHLSLALRHRW
jgi:hypothetical protein